MTMVREMDMLHGPMLRNILVYALPLAGMSVMQQLFQSIDVAVVGRFAGSEALAAVGSNTPVISMLITLFMGISLGVNIVLAMEIGQNDEGRIRRTVSTAAALAIVSGIVLMAAGLLLAPQILSWMGTPSDIMSDAVLYLRIYFIGAPFMMAYDFSAAILRARGDTRRPLVILVAAGIVNASLCVLLVVGVHLSVAGVAIATVCANIVSATLVVRLVRHEPEPFRLDIKKIHIDGQQTRSILEMGIPAGIQGMVFALSNVIVQSAINGFGAAAIAGSSAEVNFEFYCYLVINAFGGAAVTFISQNYGAGNMRRCWRAFRLCLVCALVGCGTLNVLITVFGNSFMGLFTADPEVIRYGVIRIRYVLLFQFTAAPFEMVASMMRGTGNSLLPALLTVFGTCVLRIAWVVLVFPHFGSFESLMTGFPIAWMLTDIIMGLAMVSLTCRQRHRMKVSVIPLKR